MLDHVVLLKLKPTVTREQLERMARELRKLQQHIPGILSVTIGPSTSPEHMEHGFTYGFVMHFKDAAARDAYLPHPEHQRVAAKCIAPLVEDFLVFDCD